MPGDRRLRLLDLCCGAGGASVGYGRVFDVVGVDIHPQPRFPFEFHQGDALGFPFDGFDLVHVSPPCQGYTTANAPWRGRGGRADSHSRLIDEFRDRFLEAGVQYVIENVPGAARFLRHPVALSGGWFGLGVERTRLFESSFPIWEPPYVKIPNPLKVYGDRQRNLAEAREAMGVDWMVWDELVEAIPPAYTEHIARCFLQETTGSLECVWCRNRFPRAAMGPPRLYCSNAHRQRAYRSRLLTSPPN